MTNIVVAENIAHARAVIGWLGLGTNWHPVAYGEKLDIRYDYAKIVRPLGGIEEDHLDWILEELVPNLNREADPIPSSWTLSAPAENVVSRLRSRALVPLDNLHH